MSNTSAYTVRTLAVAILLFALGLTSQAFGNSFYFQDTTRRDTSRFPIQDRRGDAYTYPNRNSFNLSDSSFIKRSVEYDPATKQYYIIEKIGTRYYRTPMTFSQEEFIRMQGRQDENEYFRKRANTLFDLNRRNVKPNFGFNRDWMNRITGNGKVDIRPSGYVDIAAGTGKMMRLCDEITVNPSM